MPAPPPHGAEHDRGRGGGHGEGSRSSESQGTASWRGRAGPAGTSPSHSVLLILLHPSTVPQFPPLCHRVKIPPAVGVLEEFVEESARDPPGHRPPPEPACWGGRAPSLGSLRLRPLRHGGCPAMGQHSTGRALGATSKNKNQLQTEGQQPTGAGTPRAAGFAGGMRSKASHSGLREAPRWSPEHGPCGQTPAGHQSTGRAASHML